MKGSNIKSFPAPTGKYKVVVNKGDSWRAHSVARIQISIGQKNHTGDKLKATLEWASNRFDKVVLIVSDTLQRHNLIAQGYDEDLAYYNSKISGLKWFDENIQAITELGDKAVITYWDDWLKHEEFDKQHDHMKELYKSNEQFKVDIDELTERFSSRTQDDLKPLAKTQSRIYLIEELAAFSIMYKTHDAIDIYPGDILRKTLCNLKKGAYGNSTDGFKVYTGVAIDHTRNKAFSA